MSRAQASARAQAISAGVFGDATSGWFGGGTANATTCITGNYPTWSFIATVNFMGINANGDNSTVLNLGLNYAGGAGFQVNFNSIGQMFVYGLLPASSRASTTGIARKSVQTIGVTYDGTTLRLYPNGSLDASTYTGLSPQASTSNILIGKENNAKNASSRNFNGIIYDIRCYGGRVLSGAEMAAYAAGTIPTNTSLVLGYAFNERTGTTTADISGNGATQTMQARNPIWLRGLAGSRAAASGRVLVP